MYYIDSPQASRRRRGTGKADVQDYAITYQFEYYWANVSRFNVDHGNLSRIIESDFIGKKDDYKIYAYKDSTSYNSSIQYNNASNAKLSKIIEYKVAIKNKVGQKHQERFQNYLINEHKNIVNKNANDMVTSATNGGLTINSVNVEFTTKNVLGAGMIWIIVSCIVVVCCCFVCSFYVYKKRDDNRKETDFQQF